MGMPPSHSMLDVGRGADALEGGLDALPDEACEAVLAARVGLDGLDRHDGPDVEGEAEAVEAGAEVGGGGGGANRDLHAASVARQLTGYSWAGRRA